MIYEQIEAIADRESKFHADEVVYCRSAKARRAKASSGSR